MSVKSILISLLTSKVQTRENAFEFISNKLCKNEKLWTEATTRSLLSLNSQINFYNHVGISIPSVTNLSELDSEPFPELVIDFSVELNKAVANLVTKSSVAAALIRNLLSLESTVECAVPVKTILNLVGRISAIPLSHTKGSSIDISALLGVAPLIKIEALRILETLISCCRGSLAVFSASINQILLRILQETSKDLKEEIVALRITCYEVVATYITTLGNMCAFNKKFVDEFLALLMKDIPTQEESITKLQKRNGAVGKSAKKSDFELAEEEKRRKQVVVHKQTSICNAALKALFSFISCCSVSLDEKSYSELSALVIAKALEIYQKRSNLSGIFRDIEVRTKFIRVLRAILLVPTNSELRPLETAIVIFESAACTETDQDLRLLCLESVNILNCIVTPVMPFRHIETSTFHTLSGVNQADNLHDETAETSAINDTFTLVDSEHASDEAIGANEEARPDEKRSSLSTVNEATEPEDNVEGSPSTQATNVSCDNVRSPERYSNGSSHYKSAVEEIDISSDESNQGSCFKRAVEEETTASKRQKGNDAEMQIATTDLELQAMMADFVE